MKKRKQRTWDPSDNRSRSRSRGYYFENNMVKRFNNASDVWNRKYNWKALRLGGTTVKIPDVVANNETTLLAIEAKSGTANILRVPKKQIIRCVNYCNNSTTFKEKWVVLAFRFSVKKRMKYEFERRKLKEYFVVFKPEIANELECYQVKYKERPKGDCMIFETIKDMVDFLEGKRLYVF